MSEVPGTTRPRRVPFSVDDFRECSARVSRPRRKTDRRSLDRETAEPETARSHHRCEYSHVGRRTDAIRNGRFPTRWMFAAGWVALTFLSNLAATEKLTDQTAIDAARQALGGPTEFPWYDQQRGQVRRVDVTPPRDVAGRRSKWEFQPVSWSWPDWLKYILEATLWLLLAVAILVIVYAFIKAMSGATLFSFATGNDPFDDAQRGDIDRVEALPFSLSRPQADLLEEARRHYEADDFAQAMIYLYSYQLVQLDRHQLIRLTKGKTNRQYLREVRSRAAIAAWLRVSMIAFEDVFFGHHQIDRERFERCWQGLDEFHQELEPVAV